MLDNRRGGFTLVEMMVATGVFITVVALSASIIVKFTNFYTESIFRSDLMESGKVTQDRILDELFSAMLISLTGAGTASPSLTFVIPVDQPLATGGNDFVNDDGDVNWGVIEAAGPMLDLPGDPHRLTFTVLQSGTVFEDAADVDLNNDGDLDDSFQVGSLVLRTTGGVERTFLARRLILGDAAGNPIDIDGDGTADPLFRIAGEAFIDANGSGVFDSGEAFTDSNLNERWDGSLAVNLLVFGTSWDGSGHRFIYRTSVKLMNN